ncbi:unnamed protein product [Peniophora sp. CBMAI 1063]|nr:unnamed protein product [Peniophora sp. CBMAI 1063]
MSSRRRTSISQLLNPASPDPSTQRQQLQAPPEPAPHPHQPYPQQHVYPYPYPLYPDPNWHAPYCILPPHYYPGPQPPPSTPISEQPSPSHTRASTPTGYPSAPRPDYYRGEPPPPFPQHPPPFPVYGHPPGFAVAQHHHLRQHAYPPPHMYPIYYPPPMSIIYAAPINYPGYPSQGPSALPAPQHPPTSGKRSPSNSGDEAPPKQKQKRSKSKGRGKAGGPDVPAPVDVGTDQGATDAPSDIQDPTVPVGPLHPELQLARCMSPRYRTSPYPRCVACTRRWAGDTCRFQGLRVFLRDAQGTFRGVTFVEARPKPDPSAPDALSASAVASSESDSEPLTAARLPDVTRLPTTWNRPMGRAERRRVMEVVARSLIEVLESELIHLRQDGCMRRSKSSDVRPTCDMCQTALFALTHICRLCGREACPSCFANIRALTPRADATVEQQADREARARANPVYLTCMRRGEHGAADFGPITRFEEKELVVVVEGMKRFLQEIEEEKKSLRDSAKNEDEGAKSVHRTTVLRPTNRPAENPSPRQPPLIQPQPLPVPVDHVAEGGNSDSTSDPSINPTTAVPLPPDTIPSRPIARYAEGELSEPAFCALLASGTPIVVSLDPARFASFTPAWFREKYGGAPCAVVETQTDSASRGTVADFFARFGSSSPSRTTPEDTATNGNANKENSGTNADAENANPVSGTRAVKLKDWPPPGGAGFRSAVPELWDALQRGLPLGSFCRRDGVLNLASHFPSSTNGRGPELGPKLYTATKTHTGAGSRGSTRLHLDAADGVNLLLHAEPAPGGSPGGAVWDLFRAEDADIVRRFLARRAGEKGADKDPLLAGAIYLDHELRHALWTEHGVTSHRTVQRAGEAVFIPAGVAHQVANVSDCIKVAVDFVSPEGIGRCEELMRACRAQNQGPAWHEDGLRLREMMWYAWVNCARMEEADTGS